VAFDRKEIEGSALGTWDADDYYVLSCPPKRRRNNITDFVWAFKGISGNHAEALPIATEIILSALKRIEPMLQHQDQYKFHIHALYHCTTEAMQYLAKL